LVGIAVGELSHGLIKGVTQTRVAGDGVTRAGARARVQPHKLAQLFKSAELKLLTLTEPFQSRSCRQ
jgi:hypothetical protein